LKIKEFFRVGVKPRAVAAGDMEKEKFGGEGVRRNVRFAKEMNAFLEERTNV